MCDEILLINIIDLRHSNRRYVGYQNGLNVYLIMINMQQNHVISLLLHRAFSNFAEYYTQRNALFVYHILV